MDRSGMHIRAHNMNSVPVRVCFDFGLLLPNDD
jgi:hypothetical protein